MSYENVYAVSIFVHWFFIIGKNCRGLRLENLNYSDQVATELLYEQIISFNEDVLTGKVMVYNPWLQWAVSGDYQYIDLIEYSNKGDSASK